MNKPITPQEMKAYVDATWDRHQTEAWSDTSQKRVDETAKQRHEQEPVIDKSAAIRIATALGWEPKRTWVGLTDEERQDIALEVPMDAVLITEAKLKEKNNG